MADDNQANEKVLPPKVFAIIDAKMRVVMGLTKDADHATVPGVEKIEVAPEMDLKGGPFVLTADAKLGRKASDAELDQAYLERVRPNHQALFDELTRIIAAAPVATATSARLPADGVEYVGVRPGWKISIIREASDGTMSIVEGGPI